MTLFVDTSIWYAGVDQDDVDHERAKGILSHGESLLLTDHVLAETWSLVRNRIHRNAAERFWEGIRNGVAIVEPVGLADLESAWQVGLAFPDQDFSLVDRTSFAVMRRLGIERAASFDDHFAIFRFGTNRRQAFEIVR